MNKETLKKIAMGVWLIVGVAILAYFGSNAIPSSQGSAPGGYSTNWSTSSQITLSNNIAYTLFATSTPGCISRVITTRQGQFITIKFGDYAGTVSDNSGHSQLSSTTVAYDSAIYGCGLWTATALGTTSAVGISVTEFSGFR